MPEGSSSLTPLVFDDSTAATRTSDPIPTSGVQGLILILITANSANTPSFTPQIQFQDADDNWHNLWIAAAAITGNATTFYKFLQAGTPTTEQSTEEIVTPIPGTIRIVLTRNTGDADTTVLLEVTA